MCIFLSVYVKMDIYNWKRCNVKYLSNVRVIKEIECVW